MYANEGTLQILNQQPLLVQMLKQCKVSGFCSVVSPAQVGYVTNLRLWPTASTTARTTRTARMRKRTQWMIPGTTLLATVTTAWCPPQVCPILSLCLSSCSQVLQIQQRATIGAYRDSRGQETTLHPKWGQLFTTNVDNSSLQMWTTLHHKCWQIFTTNVDTSSP